MTEVLYLEVEKATGLIVSAVTESYTSSTYNLVECSRAELTYLDVLSDSRKVTLSDLESYRAHVTKSAARASASSPARRKEKTWQPPQNQRNRSQNAKESLINDIKKFCSR